jgi:hypothetical protein
MEYTDVIGWGLVYLSVGFILTVCLADVVFGSVRDGKGFLLVIWFTITFWPFVLYAIMKHHLQTQEDLE